MFTVKVAEFTFYLISLSLIHGLYYKFTIWMQSRKPGLLNLILFLISVLIFLVSLLVTLLFAEKFLDYNSYKMGADSFILLFLASVIPSCYFAKKLKSNANKFR